jgi:hypothetical protein
MEQLSFKKIARKERDMAGKWRVWVEVSDNEAVILKFQKDPTATRVKEEIANYINNRLKEEENVITNA